MWNASWLIALGVGWLLSSTAGAQESEDDLLSIVQEGSTLFLKVGEKRALFCKGSAENKRWLNVRGAEVGQRSATARVHVEPSASQLVLMFDDTSTEDNGTWTCSAGDLSRTIDIYVIEEAVLNMNNPLETPLEGSNQRLTCAARGTPTPELLWYRDNVPITAETRPEKYRVSGGQLEILKVTRHDSGEYECKAHQKVAKEFYHVTSAKTLVQVRHPPVLEHDAVIEIFAIVNETKTLKCIATAYPKPTYKWNRTNKGVWTGDIDKESEFTAEDGSYSQYELQVTKEDFSETFTCTIKNERGHLKTTYHIMEGNKPQPLEQVVFQSATNESMVFEVICGNCSAPIDTSIKSATDPKHLPVMQYRFELFNTTDANVDWNNVTDQIIVVDVDRIENQTVYTVEGLQPSTTYQIRVAAVNLAGLSDYVTVDPHSTVSSIGTALSALASMVLLTVTIRQLALWH